MFFIVWNKTFLVNHHRMPPPEETGEVSQTLLSATALCRVALRLGVVFAH